MSSDMINTELFTRQYSKPHSKVADGGEIIQLSSFFFVNKKTYLQILKF